MRFGTDDQALSAWVALDDEPVDLTENGLGDRILDALVAGIEASYRAEQSPDGSSWPELASSTARRKGFATIGTQTGGLFGAIAGAPRSIEPDYAEWSYPQGSTWGRAHALHNGNPRNRQPARPFVGWTSSAQDQARQLVAEAVHQADDDDAQDRRDAGY